MLDNILIAGGQNHLEIVEMVLQRLNKYGLKANLKKCESLKDSLEFCGHKIDKDGLHKTKAKTEAVLLAPRPENVSQLRAFLGLVNYYHKFLPNLATELQTLYGLLKKGIPWLWTDKTDRAFNKAKRMVASEQVLAHFHTDVPLKLACDASPYGIGAVLSHTYRDGTERPIGFPSRTLNSAEKNYAQIDREALALVWVIKRFHHYLYGRHFVLETDHKPLTAIFRPDQTISLVKTGGSHASWHRKKEHAHMK